MKLLTHNMLECHIKGVTNKYPFKVEAEEMENCECEFNPDFLRRMYPKLDWKALKETADELKIEGLPESVSEEMLKGDESFLRAFHHALLEVEVQEGALICPETGRRFPITKGIPNLLLNEDEC
ncbi:Trm112p domain-containing protein [Chloropicon primus]|uniref:Trm112p domain-containing protein n=1 Tax=Chloropicon primus TaxID=1764295 RepID=A0A5B8MDQ7_9CHLO|nr:Trm112p domain-containing protein [Chloropicon primus]UPQ97945.1 Trm112p domain-containing protein [Chloropicon primus]|mmetsp:Transcript_804/g.2354  ORF Transcript_804/g.2354 Transcript_804/m.2354 type:complete len:124 (-) Transcript_804:121-492(-)|eukprot:QDZ18738.1 Trm112p domain-containing protein [Chloropicon primus]